MKIRRCRFPAGRSGIAEEYFYARLEQMGRTEMVPAGRRGPSLRLLQRELTNSERATAERALRCYREGGMVLWSRR